MNSKRQLLFAAILLVATGARAVSTGTALFAAPASSGQHLMTRDVTLRPVRLREVRGRGLLADVWINSAGPFVFAVDTGAGATIVSSRIVAAARLKVETKRRRSISGLTGRGITAHDARIESLAIGDLTNYVRSGREVLVTSGLPPDLDGVLDPTEAFAPFGYVIDIPRRELTVFEPRETPLSIQDQPRDGAVVPWLRVGSSKRPFVQLDNGDRALIDTGSSLGFAISANPSTRDGQVSFSRDIGGGRISAQRVRPMTIAIGTLTLRNIPTDIISGAEAGAPALLGLSALRPFRLAFDPVNRLIEIAPVDRRTR